MVDMSILSSHHGSKAAADRSRQRHWAEIRLKAYGIAAISIAGLALVALLWSVFTKAGLVLTESYLTLPVTISADEVDPAAPNTGDFNGLRQQALRAAFPQVEDRAGRRALSDLTSGGSTFDLRDAVVRDPAMIGKTVPFRFLASDDVDLYLKGEFGTLTPATHSGRLSMTITGDAAELFSTANDFGVILALTKSELIEQARFQRRQAALQENGRRVTAENAAAMADGAAKDAALAQAQTFATERDRLAGIADGYEARAARAGGTEELTSSVASVLIRAQGGWFKLTEVSLTGARAQVIVPPTSTDEMGPESWGVLVNDLPEASRKLTDAQIVWVESLRERGAVDSSFNWRFLSAGDSREAELAGVWGAVVGSFWTMLVTFCIAFPIGVLAAIYLEEFAPKNWITDLIEVNINNLAAVPSIVYGLLGLAVFLNVFGVPRSAPLAGGMVIALMTVPTIIIASRASIRAVPPSIRDAALGIGASKLQTSFHHVLPLAMPGILTGTIIGMAHALGETAPLIMIGMVAFIVDIPGGVLEPATALPVQVYRWSDFPERAFEAKTAAAICVLLVFLILMNAIAVFLRKRFERRW